MRSTELIFIMKLSSSVFALLCLICEVLALALFLRGFFPVPVKSAFSSKSQVSELPAEPHTGNFSSRAPAPIFGRVVLLLIDALRADFVLGSNARKFMPYTTDVMERGSAHSFISKARAPTVTMPRIKALTTGSIPGFIDVVMNLNSPVLQDDNLLWQAKNAGRRIIFYGDDTWLRLFPKHFIEHDGTTSFFVSDYTEVDNNVTRHLDGTLKRDDWDILILHYLGLDHIGHISGPHSSLIGPKLLEMDDIIRKIHTSLIAKESEGTQHNLLVVCGDHGMSESGSHGGSSEQEVNTALLLISTAFRRKSVEVPAMVEQVDLLPTLALALGLPVSQNSVGRLIPAVFEELPLRDQLRLLQINGHQLRRLLRDSNPTFHKEDGYELFAVAEKSHGSWMKLYLDGNTSEVLGNMGKKVLRQYLEALKAMSDALSKQLGHYDMYSMLTATIFILQVLFLLLLAMPEALSREAHVDIPLTSSLLSLPFYLLCVLGAALHVLLCTSVSGHGGHCFLCSLPWLLVLIIILLFSALSCAVVTMAARRMPTGNKTSNKEHQTWFFLLNTLCLAVFQDVCRKYFREQRREEEGSDASGHLLPSGLSFSPSAELGVSAGSEKWLALVTPLFTLCCCRLLRALNHTGVQWAHLPDFGHWLNRGIIEARFVYVFVLGILFTGVKDLLRSQLMTSVKDSGRLKSRGLWEVYSGVVLMVALLFRAHNLPTLACCLLVQTVMAQFIWKKLHYDAAQTTIMHYWFGQAFFYFQGNSNSIGTVDVSVGFVGLESYVEAPAVLLTALSTYAAPLLWTCHLLCYLSSNSDRVVMGLGHGSYCLALLRSIPAVFYVVLVTSLRYHLFIWSVFSPKLLYEAMYTLITTVTCLFFTFMDQEHLICALLNLESLEKLDTYLDHGFIFDPLLSLKCVSSFIVLSSSVSCYQSFSRDVLCPVGCFSIFFFYSFLSFSAVLLFTAYTGN
ncbi:hypothetical protein DNTS_021114 [Danionella cerebrum]|uniref:GPI ethanolamine phosphate transferase 2 C-terminal domain-containing protein n=1 Tax=Danionella cerebrum TaxID=2873325 RepID=A0A553QVF9_9TELE|nr:hypothetical protein DNTS_021114 [Danionella translucida]